MLQVWDLSIIPVRVYEGRLSANCKYCTICAPDFFHEMSLWCVGGALPLVEAHVRCFPLLAMAVSLMIASWPQYLSRSQEHCILHELFRARMVLNHRLYYQLLKHDLLISFEPLLPSQVRIGACGE